MRPAIAAADRSVPDSSVRDRATTLLLDCLSNERASAVRVEAVILKQHPLRYQAAVRQVIQHLRRHKDEAPPTDQAAAAALVQAATRPSCTAASVKRPRPMGPQQVAHVTAAQRVTPPMAQDADKFAMLVPHVFSRAECDELIRATEARGYVPATMRTLDDDAVMMPHVRDNHRVVWKDEARAAVVWERLKAFVPATLRGQAAVGCNSMIRFYRYDAGQSFAKHTDDPPYCSPTGEASMLTCIIYLNEQFEGGATRLCTYTEPDDGAVDIIPATGAAFLFEHSLLHSSTPMAQGAGRKYAMRTDGARTGFQPASPLRVALSIHPLAADPGSRSVRDAARLPFQQSCTLSAPHDEVALTRAAVHLRSEL